MAKKKQLTPEEQAAAQLAYRKKEFEDRLALGIIPRNPTRRFAVGDSVRVGHLENVIVREVIADGLAYIASYDYMDKSSREPHKKGTNLWIWTEVFPGPAPVYPPLREKDDVRIRFSNSSIDALLHRAYFAGVDFSPNYQRDLVWSLEQKQALIESIFTNVDIGKFAFVKHDYSRDIFYEILDGKQRLSTILEFYEGRFAWRGKTFADLCFEDRHHFTGFGISYGDAENLSQAQIYKYFLRLNTTGAPQDPAHLAHVASLFEQEKNKEESK